MKNTKKFYKKYVQIESKSCFKEVYYNDGELNLYCGSFTKSWTNTEIKNEVIEELEKRFS